MRSKLKQYYAGPGSADTVRIDLPSGTYVPVFTVQSEAAAHAAPSASAPHPRWPAVALIAAAVIIALAVWRLSRHTDATFTVTVIPFSNFTGNPAQDAYAAAFTDQVAVRLSDQPGIRVERVAPAPASAAGIQTIAHNSAGATLSGSLQSGDGHPHLVVHLDDAAGSQVWSKTLYSRRLAPGPFQDKASELIARTLNRGFGGRPLAASVKPLPRNQAAADFFVRGHKEWETQTREGVQNAVRLFHQAANQDPAYADAWAELGASTLYLAYLDPERADRWYAEARNALEKALSLDARNAEAHVRLGNLYLEHDWNFAAAERELQLGIELDPGASNSIRWFALAAGLRSHPDAARREVEYGLMVSPASEILLGEMARIELQSGRMAKAEEFARASLAISQNYPLSHFVLALIAERAGDLPEARAEFEACGPGKGWPFDCRASLARLTAAPDRAEEFPRHYSRALLALDARRNQDARNEIRAGLVSHEMMIEYVCLDPQFRRLFGETHDRPCAELQTWISAGQ
jgi:tetratricopeptide (TPR) repeat protein